MRRSNDNLPQVGARLHVRYLQQHVTPASHMVLHYKFPPEDGGKHLGLCNGWTALDEAGMAPQTYSYHKAAIICTMGHWERRLFLKLIWTNQVQIYPEVHQCQTWLWYPTLVFRDISVAVTNIFIIA